MHGAATVWLLLPEERVGVNNRIQGELFQLPFWIPELRAIFGSLLKQRRKIRPALLTKKHQRNQALQTRL